MGLQLAVTYYSRVPPTLEEFQECTQTLPGAYAGNKQLAFKCYLNLDISAQPTGFCHLRCCPQPLLTILNIGLQLKVQVTSTTSRPFWGTSVHCNHHNASLTVAGPKVHHTDILRSGGWPQGVHESCQAPPLSVRYPGAHRYCSGLSYCHVVLY